jgi:hypothetical protein
MCLDRSAPESVCYGPDAGDGNGLEPLTVAAAPETTVRNAFHDVAGNIPYLLGPTEGESETDLLGHALDVEVRELDVRGQLRVRVGRAMGSEWAGVSSVHGAVAACKAFIAREATEMRAERRGRKRKRNRGLDLISCDCCESEAARGCEGVEAHEVGLHWDITSKQRGRPERWVGSKRGRASAKAGATTVGGCRPRT